MAKEISKAVIQRLPRYYRYLGEMMSEGVERVSSQEFSERMNVTASQIRQDLNQFGGFGQQGYGYNVKKLYDEIALILGLDSRHSMIIIGAGNLGQALANYTNFERRGFEIKAMFDKNEELHHQKVRGIEILPMEELEYFVRANRIEIAALTLPKAGADAIAGKLVSYGIRGIWNFAHTDLDLAAGVVVENVHLSESLMQLSYRMKNELD